MSWLLLDSSWLWFPLQFWLLAPLSPHLFQPQGKSPPSIPQFLAGAQRLTVFLTGRGIRTLTDLASQLLTLASRTMYNCSHPIWGSFSAMFCPIAPRFSAGLFWWPLRMAGSLPLGAVAYTEMVFPLKHSPPYSHFFLAIPLGLNSRSLYDFFIQQFTPSHSPPFSRTYHACDFGLDLPSYVCSRNGYLILSAHL